MSSIRPFRPVVFAAACVTLALAGCASVVEDSKRSLLNRQCQERIGRLAATAQLSVRFDGETATRTFCGCFTGRVDLNQLEADFARVPRPGLNPETLRFVARYLPEMSECVMEVDMAPRARPRSL